MMDEREIDGAIDTAAGRMMAREPGRALTYRVMARVRDGADAPAPRRFVWITAVASLALCAAITIMLMNRAPATPPSLLPPASQLPIARLPIDQPPMVTDAPATVARNIAPLRRNVAAAIEYRAVSRVPPPNDVSPIEPIQTEPIALSTIEVPPLEREATSIDTLTIEPLTIEPLTASND
jgi:hypothetical protein